MAFALMHVFVRVGWGLGRGVALLGIEGNYPNGFVVVLSCTAPPAGTGS